MNARILSRHLRIGLCASTLGVAATAIAGPVVVLDHNANASPKYAALMQCMAAVRDEVGPGHGLVFSSRVLREQSTSGGQAIIVSATIWDNGARAPIEGRCERGGSDNIVATVTRPNEPVMATAGN